MEPRSAQLAKGRQLNAHHRWSPGQHPPLTRPTAKQTWTATLDLSEILDKISQHAGTRRGRLALLGGVDDYDDDDYDDSVEGKRRVGSSFGLPRTSVPSRQRWARGEPSDSGFTRTHFRLLVAPTAQQARKEYELVEQAYLLLQGRDGESTGFAENLTIPDFYGADSGPFDTGSVAETDYDEWLDCPVAAWTLEDILKADQIIQMLLRVYDWANSVPIQTWTPLLANVGCSINASVLEQVCRGVQGTVEVTRTKTAMDPTGRQSFQFRLSSAKFPVLRLLREKERDLERRAATSKSRQILENKELAGLREELLNQEETIRRGLAFQIAEARTEIDEGFSIVARLDTIVARAAFGIAYNCVIPTVKSSGQIHVDEFRHPLLESDSAVPIDLRLSCSGTTRNALIISGPNGGGKTLAMKSFGVAALFVKLGIPVPATSRPDLGLPRIDFFDHIHVSIGDRQSVQNGQSTFMGQLSEYSDLIRQTSDMTTSNSTTLLLLDEIGSGTDQSAGGAIAQAIMERLMLCPAVRLVATTHCPRLKTLSFEDPKFDCASALLFDPPKGARMPSYLLQYGIVGESHALAAASRCVPSLPEGVLERASFLVDSGNQEAAFLRTLGDSMRRQLDMAENARIQAEDYLSETIQCQSALRRLALAYERHFGQLERRLDQCYNDLKESPDTLELLGDVLSEVRTARKIVKSDAEFLREQGLRIVPQDYRFSEGETVTIISDEEWRGEMAKVCPPNDSKHYLGPDDVTVQLCLLPWSNSKDSETMVFKRSQLAIWDYQMIDEDEAATGPVTSIPDSKQKLNRVLAALESVSNRSGKENDFLRTDSNGAKSKFTSARERKASRVKKKRSK
ncbi:hypothetical protein ACA910_021522 [Epithemia clementina (nom. ined.)]